MPLKHSSILAFLAWALTGALAALSAMTILSVGLFVLPFAVGAAVTASRLNGPRRTGLGFVTGVGALVVLVGLLHVGSDTRCSRGTLECERFDAAAWLTVGGAIFVIGTAAWLVLNRHGSGR